MSDTPETAGYELVWIIPLNCYGIRTTRNLITSVVNYTINDQLYRATFENDDLLEWEEAVNDYWTE